MYACTCEHLSSQLREVSDGWLVAWSLSECVVGEVFHAVVSPVDSFHIYFLAADALGPVVGGRDKS